LIKFKLQHKKAISVNGAVCLKDKATCRSISRLIGRGSGDYHEGLLSWGNR